MTWHRVLKSSIQKNSRHIYVPTSKLYSSPAYTAYGDGRECSETSVYKIQTLENRPKERIQHSEHGESLKSSYIYVVLCT